MLTYIIRRVLLAIPTLFAISVLSFVVMQLPPGDFLTSYAAILAQQGEGIARRAARAAARGVRPRPAALRPVLEVDLRDRPAGRLRRLDGVEAAGHRPDLGPARLDRLPGRADDPDRLLIAIPIGVYSATHQYSKLDNLINAWGFLGLGIPNFTMALAVMWFAFAYFGWDLSGLFSDEFRNAPWSLGKVGDMLGHLWLPILTLAWDEVAVAPADDARQPARRAAQAVRHVGAGRRPERDDR